MARIARIVVPGIPHHITQRGNRRQQTFFTDEDCQCYLGLLREWCAKAGVEIWAYCLMPNHVHLIAVPEAEDSLRRGIAETHRRYTRYVNFSKGWKGYLWQGRFASFPMDEHYLLAAARYVELNPLRAGLVKRPEDYRWSSVHAHLEGQGDGLVNAEALLSRVDNWRDFLKSGLDDDDLHRLRGLQSTGRPAGSDGFIEVLENRLNRSLKKQKPGPKGNN
jgi:putative transposase